MSAAKTTIERVRVTTLSNDHDVDLVVHTTSGKRPGPRLAMFGSVHGDEPLGSEIVRRVLSQIDPDRLQGSIVAVPVANPYAHLSLARSTPLDGVNLNRVFPGVADGSLTEQLAYRLAGILERDVTHFIDYHSGGNFATVDYSYLHDPGREMAKAYGRPLLYSGPGYVGTSSGHALSLGIATTVSELGGGGQRIGEFLDIALRGSMNMLRAIGMLDDAPVEKTRGQQVIETLTVLRPPVGGVLLSQFDATRLGESVPKGTVLGRIVSPTTFEELAVIEAPYEPSILVLVRESVTNVSPGDYGFMVADGASAKAVE